MSGSICTDSIRFVMPLATTDLIFTPYHSLQSGHVSNPGISLLAIDDLAPRIFILDSDNVLKGEYVSKII